MIPSSPKSATTPRTASICAKPRSGAILRRIGTRAFPGSEARPVRRRDRGQKLAQARLVLELPQARRVGARDVEHDIVGVVGEPGEAREVVLGRAVEVGHLRLAEVDAEGIRRRPGRLAREAAATASEPSLLKPSRLMTASCAG
jgi:hypothetical protein